MRTRHWPRHTDAIATVFVGAMLVSGSTFAESGYYAGSFGAKASGRGGAFAAAADDLTAVHYNPAGLAKLNGTIIELGNQLSYNGYFYTRSSTTDYGASPSNGEYPRASFKQVKNGTPFQPVVPMLGVASKLGLEDWAFALAAYAPPGSSKVTFPQDGGQNYQMISREAIFMNFVGSIAWKYEDVFGIGVTGQWIYAPTIRYTLMIDGNPFSKPGSPVHGDYDILATMNASSKFTFNGIIGAWLRPAPFVELAVSGQVVPANIVGKGTLTIQPIGSAVSDATVRPNQVTVTMPLPLVGRAGARYRYLEAGKEIFDIELDAEYTTWSRVKQFDIDTGKMRVTASGSWDYVPHITIAKNWKDTLALKLGGDYAVMPGQLTLRAGGFYETALNDAAYSSVDFFGGPQYGGSLGASLFFGDFQLLLAYAFRLQQRVQISEGNGRGYPQIPLNRCKYPDDTTDCNPNYPNAPGPVVNAGTYDAYSHFMTIDAMYHF